MSRSVTPTIEGGLLVAITVIMGLVTVYVPLIGMVVEFFCALPLAILTARQGVGKGLTALVVTFLLLSILISPLLAARLILSFGVCGVTLGWCVQKNFGAVRTFLATLMIASAAQVATLWLLLFVMDVNIVTEQIELVRESFNESFSLYESMGVDKARIAEAKEQVEPAIEATMHLIPVLLMFSALFSTVAVWFSARLIFPKLQLKLPQFPPFAQWKFPVAFLYMAAFSLLSLYWGVTRGWTQIYDVSLNLLVVAMLVGLVQGLSLLSFMFDRFNVSKFLRRIFYVLILLNMFFLQLVAVTGLMDMFFDYRRKLRAKDEGGD